MLKICAQNLLPHGVAIVSYNTYPGWHQRQMVREMMLYHTRGIEDPYEQSERSLDLLGFLAEASIGRLFAAGIVPGLLLAVALMLTTHVLAIKRRYKPQRATRASARELRQAASRDPGRVAVVDDPVRRRRHAQRQRRGDGCLRLVGHRPGPRRHQQRLGRVHQSPPASDDEAR